MNEAEIGKRDKQAQWGYKPSSVLPRHYPREYLSFIWDRCHHLPRCDLPSSWGEQPSLRWYT